ncbi:restriction endonuclease subunit S [Prevotella pectinovora]|uniref:restriction endonuclease subunit S n=1 Tax=Prevotella pectinovora TaxID=1602169 RepID=UPI0006982B5A|nr:restriction endonuclease subunit S [Prevotella pectinovora]
MKLGELIEIKHGYAFSGEHIVEDDNGIVLVTPGNFRIGGGFKEEKCKFFDGEIPADYVLKEGDFIVTMTDLSKTIDTLGYSALVPKSKRTYLHNQRIGLVTFKSGECDRGYIYWLMRTREYQRSIANTSTGATVHHTSPKKIYDYDLEVPPLPIQHRIATILSRYDSLIENYQKQIKLLEEAAQRLYKEWFIDLRFPGHENTKIVDDVPEGWEKKKLIELVDVQYGYAFDGKLFNNIGEGMPILRIRNIPDGITSDYTTEEASKNYIVHNGDIVVGMDGIFHINSWNGDDAYLVQRACSFRPKEECVKGVIFQAIQEPIKFFEKTLVGATVAHLGKKHIDSIELCIPKNFELYQPFSKFYNQRQGLLSQIRLLTEARDRLLPKLMGGEIKF